MTETIYRVENSNQTGCYRLYECAGMMMRHDRTQEIHPVPQADPEFKRNPFYMDESYYFGFDTMDKFHNWFDEQDRIEMKSLGYKLSVYEIDTEYTFSSKFQSVFFLDEAELIERFELI